MELEWKMGIEYIKNKVDFCFLHTEGKERNIENLHCIEDMLGKDILFAKLLRRRIWNTF